MPDVELYLPARPESVSIARQAVCGVGDALLMEEGRIQEAQLQADRLNMERSRQPMAPTREGKDDGS